ncbi:hypothetical protein BPAE_0224g00140 [Botrytis paeoniae]|uniref:Uncharacterized protein n=1 Tax=Botrytis paeoniae TaxID=278948 RepID=A0A4Z1FAC3_9HELO|nr:hypothetical protein BPAE_0224g00140 [Botrytis paeoniae]
MSENLYDGFVSNKGESHATSCCPICQLDHQNPHYWKILHPEDEGGAPLKSLPPLEEIPRLSMLTRITIAAEA